MDSVDTIFALSSGAPPAAIAVMRISGPRAFDAVKALAGTVPQARKASLRKLHDPENGSLLDEALVLVFPGPATATGEDLAELHLHGGRAVVRGVENALAHIQGLRRAEAGEFTRRAFANGRIDLNEAEGLADLLAAETEWQRRSAAAMAGGAFSAQVEQWREALLRLAAMLEAELDFSDEDDVGEQDYSNISNGCIELHDAISGHLNYPAAEKLRDGLRVVLAGPPNSGKSTLLNLIAGFEQPSQGQLLVDGQGVRAPGPDRGVVFQEAALFPWLSVWENVIFGPKVQGMARSEYEDRAHEMIKIVGLSDFTAFQNAVAARSGAVTWSGPALLEDFGVDGTPDDIMDACFEDLASGAGEGTGWQLPRAEAREKPLRVKGRLWGGNLSVLVSLVGTPYLPDTRGGLLFLEDVNEHPFRIERMLTQLLHAGILAQQKAILLGQFTQYRTVPHDKGFKLQTVVDWLRSQVKVPVLTGLPFGHVPTKVCLPVGLSVDLVVEGRDALVLWGHAH